MSDPDHPTRQVLMVVNTRRDRAVKVAEELRCALLTHDVLALTIAEDGADYAAALGIALSELPHWTTVSAGPEAARHCELAVVVGGDGTILRAAEYARAGGVPVLGVNVGHVGFLAEAEVEDVDRLLWAIVARDYRAEERLTLDVDVYEGPDHDRLLASTWALNEASVEKSARERMLEVVVEVDDRPLSRWGCDGVVCATPTGSTAYNFSAGGPVVWPEVDALLIVPISAHALFARPMVVAPSSVMAVEIIESGAAGVLWCDGRRTVELPPGARIEVRRGSHPVRLARLHEEPFTDRLVAKFHLPVTGWRGAAEHRHESEAR